MRKTTHLSDEPKICCKAALLLVPATDNITAAGMVALRLRNGSIALWRDIPVIYRSSIVDTGYNGENRFGLCCNQ